MEWRIKLEARSGWGEVEKTIEVAYFKRHVVGLTSEEIGLSLEEAKRVLAELRRLAPDPGGGIHVLCPRLPGLPQDASPA